MIKFTIKFFSSDEEDEEDDADDEDRARIEMQGFVVDDEEEEGEEGGEGRGDDEVKSKIFYTDITILNLRVAKHRMSATICWMMIWSC